MFTQIGYNVEQKYPICFACKTFCKPSIVDSEVILNSNFTCLCFSLDKYCKFSECLSLQDDRKLAFLNIKGCLEHHAEAIVIKDKKERDKLKKETLARNFDFEKQ